MARFFINRPIVAMVISIIMVILGVLAMVQLPIALFPNIAPPEIQLQATYVGADAVSLEKSVATPIEQMMSGVDNMIYMYSVNANNGQMTLRVDFDINTRPNDRPDPDTDAVLAGRIPVAAGGAELRGDDQEIHDQSSRAVLLVLPKRHVRRNLPGQLCLCEHQ